MASPRIRRLRNYLISLATMALGLWLAGSALWQLARTAVFVHESVVVTGTVLDLRQKPFESWAETIGQGNWSMPGDISYQPIVRFTLPGDIDAIRLDLEADNEDYRIGDTISIISPPGQPGKARINRWKFLWGASCLRLTAGALLTLMGYGLWRRLRGRRPAAPAPARAQKPAARQPEPEAKAPARRRKSASAEGGSTPRRRKKSESSSSTQETAPKKPRRRSSKKKAAEQSPELPL